ncbi:hypothetical protein BRI6_1916 [plant metagenome]|uniref:Uncharacterized protein n=1 Tax=plant metagenome TaxID=1297885 RepID=A0A484RTB8_9ZZZZ
MAGPVQGTLGQGHGGVRKQGASVAVPLLDMENGRKATPRGL